MADCTSMRPVWRNLGPKNLERADLREGGEVVGDLGPEACGELARRVSKEPDQVVVQVPAVRDESL